MKENRFLSFLSEHRNFLLWLGIGVLLVIADQVSKWIAQANLTLGQPVALIPNFLYATLYHNTKVAFGWGVDGIGGRILNIAISLGMSAAISIYWGFHHRKFKKLEKIVALLLLSGAVGNLIDRAFYWSGTVGFDGVIDFIQFYLGGGPSNPQWFLNPFATFNFADAYLSIGVVMLLIVVIIDMVKNGDKSLTVDPRSVPSPSEEESKQEDENSEDSKPLEEEKKEESK